MPGLEGEGPDWVVEEGAAEVAEIVEGTGAEMAPFDPITMGGTEDVYSDDCLGFHPPLLGVVSVVVAGEEVGAPVPGTPLEAGTWRSWCCCWARRCSWLRELCCW
jgi:hypothetical protein